MRPALVVDIETVPDEPFYRRLHPTPTDEAATSEPRGLQKPLYHQVVAIAICHIGPDGGVEQFKALESEGDEPALVRRFWDGFARLAAGPSPRLVTFNGRRFDLPVLVQRALLHGIAPTPFWRGDYRQRYRDHHLDLMDFLSDYGATTPLSQHELAVLLGVPGKLGLNGADVLPLWMAGRREEIAAYCACDVATLTLCFSRLGVQAGWITADEAARLTATLRHFMEMAAASTPLLQMWLDQAG